MAAAIQVSRAHLTSLAKKYSGAQEKLKRVSAKAEKAMGTVFSSAITVGTCAGLGLLHGRHGAVELAGIPLELAGGVALTGAALLGIGGKFHNQVAAAGSGMLGIYGYNMAKGAGKQWKEKSGESTTKGALPGAALRREEIETMDRPTVAQRQTA